MDRADEHHTRAERNETFKRDARLIGMLSHYRYLYSMSMAARYKCKPLEQDVYKRQVRPQLTALKRHIQHALTQKAAGK
jgi:hypothetical protein